MKVQPIRRPGADRRSWIVLDDRFLPVQPISAYLSFRENLNYSPDTIRTEAHHLKLYWEFLRDSGLDWVEVDVERLATFIPWLRSPNPTVVSTEEQIAKRTDATIDQILVAVHSFYDFHARSKTVPELALYKFLSLPNRRYKPFLHGIARSKPARTRVVRVKPERRLPKVLTRGQVEALVGACSRTRDQLLLMLLYDTGIRIGQALGLRHEDISVERGEIRVVPRDGNPNGARAKRDELLTVFPSPTVMDLYVRYVVEDLDGLEVDHLPDFVFVNLWGGEVCRPMRYEAVRSLLKRLGARAGKQSGTTLHATPHMLRHTRATEWIRDDKLPLTTVSRLLGHKSTQITDSIYTHLTAEDVRAELDAARERQEALGG